jgi:hypothetical protein
MWTADLVNRTNLTLEAKDPSRATLVEGMRPGTQALRLQTIPGDDHISGSGNLERCDVYQCVPGTADPVVYQDQTIWVAHSIKLPDDFQWPLWHPYVLFDFHNKGTSVAANLHVNFRRIAGDDLALGELQIQLFSGDPMKPTETAYVTLGRPPRNTWLNFLHHIRWTSGSTGFCHSWLNGLRVLAYKGQTLYRGQGVFLKLANYHLPFRPGVDGTPTASAVIHDRVVVGTTMEEVTA